MKRSVYLVITPIRVLAFSTAMRRDAFALRLAQLYRLPRIVHPTWDTYEWPEGWDFTSAVIR